MPPLRPLAKPTTWTCVKSRSFSSSVRRNADFTHAVIGGGVVGLAIARKLQEREGASTVLIEKHGQVGMETSSRNSEVIHAGLYYPANSLKTTLCLRGKEQLYSLCAQHSIPHRNTGKWIVAQDATQFAALEKLHAHAQSIGVPTRFLSRAEAQRREPDVRAEAGVLESPTTGIVDSHSLMKFLEGEFENSGGVVAFKSPVSKISPIDRGKGGWEISVTIPSNSSSGSERQEGEEEETTTITTSTLTNAAGLFSIPLRNSLLPASAHLTPYYAKGTYFSYPLSSPRPSTLVYPAPVPGHAGLGTHLTLDLSGRVRFGPDVEWTDDPAAYKPNDANLPAALDDIQTYLPGIERGVVAADYVGIRPKLGRAGAVSVGGGGKKDGKEKKGETMAGNDGGGDGGGFQDFWIRKEEGFEGWVNLLGIESPGLTSALAIAERVEGLLYE